MPLCIYNIKKSLSLVYTEENPSQGDSPRQFDDVQKNMKLEKEQITEKREELCKVLVAMNGQKAKIRGNSPTASPQ